jgi:hypothetical protein
MNKSLNNKEETTYRKAKEREHGETQKTDRISEKYGKSRR